MYLLDTNLISEIRKMPKGKCGQGVEQWVKTTSQNLMFTSAVVLMELERGILAMERKDMAQGTMLRTWFEKDVLPAFQSKILSVNEQTAHICAKLHIPDHAHENDAWVAASAIQHNLVLVTRNTDDFARTGVRLLNPFQE